METRKNNNSGQESERLQSPGNSSDASSVNDEENLDTRFVSNDVEEGDEDYDDELTEADFDIDDQEEEEDEN